MNPKPPTCEDGDCFENCVYVSATLYVPIVALKAYRDADVWREFFNIREMEPTRISGSATNAQATVHATQYARRK